MTTIFNPKQVPAITNTVSVVDTNGNSLANNFLVKSGDVMYGNLIMEGNQTKIVYPNGSSQTTLMRGGYSNWTVFMKSQRI